MTDTNINKFVPESYKIMASKHLVLYVEDNPANMRLVEQLLKTFPDITLIGAETAEDGLEMIKEQTPDLILMDINLPGMSGYDALVELKKQDMTKAIPVVAISANALASDFEKGIAAGFADYITKPINLQSFFSTIKKHLNIS